MAGYRQIHTQIWKDEWFIDLAADEKLLFIYLFSNDLASISGLYRIPIRVICNETGFNQDFVAPALAKFQLANKVFYQDGTIWVVNMTKYHKNSSDRTQKKVSADIDLVPDGYVKGLYLYHLSHPEYGIDIICAQYEYYALKAKAQSESKAKAQSQADGGAPEYSPPPPDEFPVILDDVAAEQIYISITKRVTFPSSDRENAIIALQKLRPRYADRTLMVEDGRRYYAEAQGRYSRTVRDFWLTDWWVGGNIPPPKSPNGQQKPPTLADLGYTEG